MKVSFTKYPDVVVYMLISIVLIPLSLFNLNETLRIILSLPFILFIPGYILIFALFPQQKSKQGIDTIERIALSFGLSIGIVSLLAFLLNYTLYGIHLQVVLFFLFFFIMVIGFIGLYRWFVLPLEQRLIVTINFSFPKPESKLDKALPIILVIFIVIIITLLYLILTPRPGEPFTEFYILGPGGTVDKYPSMLAFGENATGFVGIVNHENKTMNYTVEVWLLKQTTFFNESSLENKTSYLHMWFIDKIEVSLDYKPVDYETPWALQWQHYFSYPITEPGLEQLMFLLYTNDTNEYISGRDYVFLADEKIANAYEHLNLWLRVPGTQFYLLDSNGMQETYTRNLSVGQNVTGKVGIVNNELRAVNYTIDIWLVNQTTLFNETSQENLTVIHNMWYLDSIKAQLNYTEESPAWEQNYSVTIHRTGSYKVMFFLYTTPTEGYLVGEDYKDRASLIFAAAQMKQSIWVNVT